MAKKKKNRQSIFILVLLILMLFSLSYIFIFNKRNKTVQLSPEETNFYKEYFSLIQARVDYLAISKLDTNDVNFYEKLTSVIDRAKTSNREAYANFNPDNKESILLGISFPEGTEEKARNSLIEQNKTIDNLDERVGDLRALFSFYPEKPTLEELKENSQDWIELSGVSKEKISESERMVKEDISGDIQSSELELILAQFSGTFIAFENNLYDNNYQEALDDFDGLIKQYSEVKREAYIYVLSPMLSDNALATMRDLTNVIYSYEFYLKPTFQVGRN